MNTSELLSKFKENFVKLAPSTFEYKIVDYEKDMEIYHLLSGEINDVIPTVMLDTVYKARKLTDERVLAYATINGKKCVYIAIHILPV